MSTTTTTTMMMQPQLPYSPERHSISNCQYGDPLFPSRLNRVPASQSWRTGVLGAIFGIAIIVYFVAFVCFIIRIRKKPLKERSPFLLLISAFAGTLGLYYMYSRLFLDLLWVCPITYYIIIIALINFFVPYLLRCYRTLMMWRFYQASSRGGFVTKGKRDQGGEGDEVGSRPSNAISRFLDNVAVYHKFFYSEAFLVLVMVGVFIVWIIAGIIVQVVLASTAHIFDPYCQKQCNLHEGASLKVLSVMCEVAIFIYMGLVALMWNIQDEFSIRNELLALCLFSFVCVTCMLVIQFIPSTSWPEQPYIGYILGIELIGSFIISVCYPLFKSFTRDIFLVDLFSRLKKKQSSEDGGHSELIDTPSATPSSPSAVPLSTTQTEVEQGKPADQSNSEQPKNEEPKNEEPKNEEPKNEEPKNEDTSKTPKKSTKDNTKQKGTSEALVKNKEMEEFLTNKTAKDVFKQFLVREFSVENLMFYTEVQYFKQLSDSEEIKETAQQVFDTYVIVGAPFEINIPVSIRTRIDQVLKSGTIPLDTFSEPEKIVYSFMEKESFPRFQKNKLYTAYKASVSEKVGSLSRKSRK